MLKEHLSKSKKKLRKKNLTGEQAEKDKIRKEAYDAGREKGLKKRIL